MAENGSGTYGVGQADYLSGTEGTKLYLAVGSQFSSRPATLASGTWYHLAIVNSITATQRTSNVYLNGSLLGSPLVVAAGASQLPQGTLRFGKRSTGQTVNGHDAQYYGLLDDVAVFVGALTAAQIQSRQNVPHLTGSEPNLLAGYTFASGRLPTKLARSVVLHGAAHRVSTCATRDSAADAALLPLPTKHQPMDLPFPPGEAWYVIQGVDSAGGSHKGYASFCWDFSIADQPQDGEYPSGSDGAPFYACAPGLVVTSKENSPPGTSRYSNLVEVEQAAGEICAYLHLRQDSAEVNNDAQVKMGQKLALTGDTGANVGAHHVHLAASDKPDKTSGFVTFPVAFSDYEVRTRNNGWQTIQRGMPRSQQVIRIPPTPTFGKRSLRVTSAIARDANRLDLVATDVSGRGWLARWAPGVYARNWDRWRALLSDIASVNTPIGVVSQDANRLDIFIAGADGKTWTGAWDKNVATGQWRGWWNILTGAIPAGGAVTAVSRSPNKLDVFIVSTDGGVYTAAWDHNVADGQWRGWWRIGNLVAKPGAPVAAVARDPNKLDVFVAGIDGKTYTAAWDHNVANGQWRGWWDILTGAIPSGGEITAVARDANKLDIFLVSTDGGIYTAAWEHNVADGQWRGWWRIGSLVSKPGAPVGVVARDPKKLDVFVGANDGKTYTAAWDRNVANGQWRGWWNILTGAIDPGGQLPWCHEIRTSWTFSSSALITGSTPRRGTTSSLMDNGAGGGGSDDDGELYSSVLLQKCEPAVVARQELINWRLLRELHFRCPGPSRRTGSQAGIQSRFLGKPRRPRCDVAAAGIAPRAGKRCIAVENRNESMKRSRLTNVAANYFRLLELQPRNGEPDESHHSPRKEVGLISMRHKLLAALALISSGSALVGQLTPEQRVQDFQSMVGLFQRRYAPIAWKKQALNFDLLDVQPWLERVRRVRSDIEYHEIALEYVAMFQDSHTAYRAPGTFTASLGITVDIYDGKVLVEAVDRMRLPPAAYPIQIGDELVSVDGKSAEQWIADISKLRRWGNPVTTRRWAADAITFRAQTFQPRAAELGDTATVVLRRADGELTTYTIPWQKTNLPFRGSPGVPGTKTAAKPLAAAESEPEYMRFLNTMWNWSTAPDEPLFMGEIHDESGNPQPRRYLLGVGSRVPTFDPPPGFVPRVTTEFHTSGVYESDGVRIGFLRIPNFSPPSLAAAIRELETEVQYFNDNTDVLVLDVTRNPGGGCYMHDVAARLIPHEFWFFGEEIRPTWDRILGTYSALENARRLRAEQWIIDVLSHNFNTLLEAYSSGALLSAPIAACGAAGLIAGPWENPPAAINYKKPIVLLIDEFSNSAGDIFPAMMQDNKRALLVGMRTSGGGGRVSGWPVGYLTEALSSNTDTLVIRRGLVANAPDLPPNRYVENTGVRPDIELDRMTREDLLQRGRPYVEAFTRIAVDYFRSTQ